MTQSETLYDKLWNSHIVNLYADDAALLYVDRHLLHECSTPQSFALLRNKGCITRRPETHLAVPDHAVPTQNRAAPIADPLAKAQVARLETNANDFGIRHIALDSSKQGIVHVIGPEAGFTLPGITLACGDSHTSTHGAFGALAFGIGASDCATIIATNCIVQTKAKNMEVRLEGLSQKWVSAKDYALALIGKYGTGCATGHAIEYRGAAVDAMSMAARMTLCNMSIEAGARVGMIAPDATTFAYLEGREYTPKGHAFVAAKAYWETLFSDEKALFDKHLSLDVGALAPQVTWGTSPQDALGIDGCVPHPDDAPNEGEQRRWAKAQDYMGLKAGTALEGIPVNKVFIGSCTNGRLDDLREAARVVEGHQIAANVEVLVVPGSTAVKHQAEAEGLDRIFEQAGFQWREAGCSMCVAMNPDRLEPGERCASTSNRNFEGRQGKNGRTHLMSPASAAATAITGHLTDVRSFMA